MEVLTRFRFDAVTGAVVLQPEALPMAEGVAPPAWGASQGMPRVSVVILSHRLPMVAEAIASVGAQTAQPLQLLVQHSALAWPEKLNAAITATVGEFFVVLCDDDLLAPSFVAECLAWSDDADIVYTDRRHFRDGTDPWMGEIVRMHEAAVGRDGPCAVTIQSEQFAFGAPFPMTCLVRRSFWDALGGFDPTMPHTDTEFWYRAARAKARGVYVPSPLFAYREHEGQYSRTDNALWHAGLKFHKKHFDQFGFAWDHAVPVGGNQWDIPVIPPHRRATYYVTP